MNTIIDTPVYVLDIMQITAEAAHKIAAKAGHCIQLTDIVKDIHNPDDEALKSLAIVGGLIREIAEKAIGVHILVSSTKS
jgi:hypothetical protein